MSFIRIGMLAWRVERTRDAAGWARRLEREVATAASAGAHLLLLPEYALLEAAAGEQPDVAAELRRAVILAPTALETARDVARRHGVWLLPGTMPFRDGDRLINRAPLIAPDGRVAFQDKHVMTRFEAEEWGIAPGAPPAVFETAFGRIGVAICFDAEFPHLVRAQVEAGAWLVLVPSCTDTLAGYHRVRLAASARAMENQCFVAMAPTVGDAPWSGALDANRGAAGAFGPVDRGFAENGIVAEGMLDVPGWVYADLDPARLDVVRREGAVRNHIAWPPAPPPCPVRAPA
jgi:predicted amidohydrolase